MKAIRVIVLIALIAIPSSSFAWSRGGAVVVRPGFPSRAVFVRTGFPGGSLSSDPGLQPSRFRQRFSQPSRFRQTWFSRTFYSARIRWRSGYRNSSESVLLSPILLFSWALHYITILRATSTILITIHLPIPTQFHHRPLPRLRPTPMIADIPKDTLRAMKRL